MAELARIAGHAGAQGLQERLSSLTTVWIDQDREPSPMPQDSSNLDIEVYEIIGDFLEECADPRPPWFDCLREACYAMAADPGLQRHFMSDFYRFRFDYGAYYELWIGGGRLRFDGRCLVTSVKRR